MPTHLSVQFECWNCSNGCPTHDNGIFKYLAIEPNLDGRYYSEDSILGEIHPICKDCYDGGDFTANVHTQTSDGLIEVPSRKLPVELRPA